MWTKRPRFKYKYSRLESGQIRLLKPQPDDPTGLKWELQSVPLLESDGDGEAGAIVCDYDALSYTWGEADKEGLKMICNGRALKVQKNLYGALPFLAKRLRRADSSSGRIWIDAVCINQNDKAEKSEQIGRMSAIYRLARQVVVWLGPGHGKDHNDAAIDLLPLLRQIGGASMKYAMDSRQPQPDFSGSAMPDASSPVWKVLGDIIFNGWYTRLWVVQELLLSQSAVALVGDSMLDFDEIEVALKFMMGVFIGRPASFAPGVEVLRKDGIQRKIDFARLGENLQLVILRSDFNGTADMEAQNSAWRPSAETSDEHFSTSSPQTSVPQNVDPLLTGIYLTTMSQQCGDPRDRVFGVLGFAGDGETEALGLKDKEDLAELYVVFMGYAFKSGGRIIGDVNRRFMWEVFSYACLPNKTLQLPSWCPDLQVQREPSTPNGLSLLAKRGFAEESSNNIMGFGSNGHVFAADASVVDMRIGESQNVLVVKGTLFGRIKEVLPAFPKLDISSDLSGVDMLEAHIKMHAGIGQWEKEIAARVLGPQGVGTRDGEVVSLDTYWRTLVGNQTVLSAGDSEFTYETLYALRDFHARISSIKTRFDELKQR